MVPENPEPAVLQDQNLFSYWPVHWAILRMSVETEVVTGH